MRNPLCVLASALVLAPGALPAGAYVEAVYPLQQVIAESEVIAEGVVEKHDPGKKIAFIKIQKSLKGKCHYDVIRINYGGGQFYHPAVLPKHLVPGAPAIIFYNAGRQSQTYLNRFFFQIYGDAGAPPEKAWWNMTHIEIRMNRTFNGTVPQLSELLQKILSGRAKAPAPDPRIPPMDEATLKALPAHGEPADETTLPAPFLPRTVKLGKPREAVNPGTTMPGLAFDYYEGQWTALPDFGALKPVQSGQLPDVSLSPRKRDTHFGLRFTGFVEVPRDGVYTFYTSSNDGSKLHIGDQEVVQNDHHHGVVESFGEIALKAGKHPLRVVYFQEGGNRHLEVHWEGPELPKQRIPPQAYSRIATP
jgi:hypothetical protein